MLPLDLILLVCDYAPRYVILDWVEEQLVIHFGKRYMRQIWEIIIANPYSADYVMEHLPESICPALYEQPWVVPLLDRLPLNRNAWKCLSGNPAVIEFLERHPHKINWRALSANPEAIHLLEKNIDKINWSELSYNDKAGKLWENNLDKMNWNHCAEGGPIEIIKTNIDKMNWDILCINDDAIEILKKNIDKISYDIVYNVRAIEIMPELNAYIEKFSKTQEYEPSELYYLMNIKNEIIYRYSDDVDYLIKEFIENGDNTMMYSYSINYNKHMINYIEKNRHYLRISGLLNNFGIFKPTKNQLLIDILLRLL